MNGLTRVIHTLQYCLETFEQNCACGRCDPCTLGQGDIRQAIRTIENLNQSNPNLAAQSEFEKATTMIQKIKVTTRADLVDQRKQQYLAAGYRIENECSLPNGMYCFTAIRTVQEEPTSELG